MLKNAAKALQDFGREEEAVGVVEIILILVVLIALVVLFRDSLQDLVENILDRVTNSANTL